MWMWCWGRRTAWGLTGEGSALVSTQPPPAAAAAAAVNNSMFRSGAVGRVCCARVLSSCLDGPLHTAQPTVACVAVFGLLPLQAGPLVWCAAAGTPQGSA